MENQTNVKKAHTLSIEQRNKGTVTGVEKVISSNDCSIQLHTTEGGLQLNGKEFKIKKFSQDEGVISFEGEVDSIKYSQMSSPQKGGMFKKMFK